MYIFHLSVSYGKFAKYITETDIVEAAKHCRVIHEVSNQELGM